MVGGCQGETQESPDFLREAFFFSRWLQRESDFEIGTGDEP